MKEPFSDEILSAYVDGELSPHERGEVESWLESNPTAREKLDDFRRLAALFDSFPRTELPQEFPTTVMQLAERRMLLPESRTVAPGWRAGRWIVAVGAPIASAAVLFVVVSLALRDADVREPGVREPGAENANRAAEPQAGKRDLFADNDIRQLPEGIQSASPDESRQSGATVAQQNSDRQNLERSGFSKSGDAPTELGSAASAPAGGSADSPVPPAKGLRMAAKKNGANAAVPLAVGAPFDKGAANVQQLAEFNQTIQDLRERKGESELVTVVKLYVADKAEGMVLLQNVLADNEILSDTDMKPSADDHVSRKSFAREQADAAVENEALYVVAEPEQLTAAFTAMLAREHPGVRMAVEEPIEIAALDADVQEKLQEIAPGVGGSRGMRRKIADDEPPAFDKAQTPADGKSASTNAPPAADAPAPAAPKAAAKSDSKPESKSEGRGPAGLPAEKKPLASGRPEPGKPPAAFSDKDAADGNPQGGGRGGAARPGADQAPGASDSGSRRAGKQNPVPQDAAGRGVVGRSRQLVVPMPEAIRQRMESSEEKRRTELDSETGEKLAAPVAAGDARRDEIGKAAAKTEPVKKDSANPEAENRKVSKKDSADKETVQHEPLLVRLLIVVEPEPANAAAREAAPPSEVRGNGK